MIYPPTASPARTKPQGVTFEATPEKLHEVLGEPTNPAKKHNSLEWVRELATADVFTISNMGPLKEFSEKDPITWSINAENRPVAEKVKNEINKLINS